MDAVSSLRRCLLAAALVTAHGCQSEAGAVDLKTRAQVPPAPAAPPIVGLPVTPINGVNTASYTALPAIAKGAELLKGGVPQIKVVALVGATNLVTDQEVIEAVRQRHLRELETLIGSAREAKEKEKYATELRQIIERELIIDEMYSRLKKGSTKVDKTEEIKEFAGRAAEQHLRMMRKEWKVGSEEEFLSVLRSHGLSLQVFRRQIERQMMADEYIRSVLKEKGRTPGLADIRDHYDRNPDEFKTDDQVKWLDIFISFGQHASPRAAYDHAEMVRQKAAGGADFVALSKEYDNGLARGTNGVGIGSKKGEIKPVDVEPTVWALRPGEVSNLIQTPAGYHIVKVAERQFAGVRTYDAKLQAEIRDKLLLKYREAEYRKVVEDLWRKGAVRVIENP